MTIKKSVLNEEYSSELVNSTQSGDGFPVILVHGLAASIYDWNDLIPDLAKEGYAHYALDLLGHGLSYKPDHSSDYNISNVIAHFEGWISSLKLNKPVIIIGHSLGAYIAIKYSLQFPERVASLVLCDPFYSFHQLPFLLRLNYRYSIFDIAMIESVPEWLIKIIIDVTSVSIRNGYELPESVRKQTASDYKRAEPRIFNIVHTIEDLTPSLQWIKQPTLIIWGEHDQTLNLKSFDTLSRKIPDAKSHVVMGAGHVPHQSHPAIFNKIVLDFFNTLSLGYK